MVGKGKKDQTGEADGKDPAVKGCLGCGSKEKGEKRTKSLLKNTNQQKGVIKSPSSSKNTRGTREKS